MMFPYVACSCIYMRLFECSQCSLVRHYMVKHANTHPSKYKFSFSEYCYLLIEIPVSIMIDSIANNMEITFELYIYKCKHSLFPFHASPSYSN